MRASEPPEFVLVFERPRTKDRRKPIRWLRVSGASLTSWYYSHIWTFWPAPLMLLTKPCPDAPYDKEPSHDDDSRATLRAGVHRIYLPPPLDADARAEMQTGLSPRL